MSDSKRPKRFRDIAHARFPEIDREPPPPENPEFDSYPEAFKDLIDTRMQAASVREHERAEASFNARKAACERRFGKGTYHGERWL